MITQHTTVVRRDGDKEISRVADEVQLYTVNELKEQFPDAYEKAYRQWTEYALDYEWWDCTYNFIVSAAEAIGISIGQGRNRRFDISFEGFYSQRDGAAWGGSYMYAKGAHKAVRKLAPEARELHRIADKLYEIQRHNGYGLYATVEQGRSTCASGLRVRVYREGGELQDHVEDAVDGLMRDFANWIFYTLRAEYEFQLTKEQFDEASYDDYFTEDGVRR